VIEEPDYELLMIDASYIKIHPHGSGARGDNQDMSKTSTKIHLAMDAHGMPIRAIITQGPTHDTNRYHA